jgi:hypothetical protein
VLVTRLKTVATVSLLLKVMGYVAMKNTDVRGMWIG